MVELAGRETLWLFLICLSHFSPSSTRHKMFWLGMCNRNIVINSYLCEFYCYWEGRPSLIFSTCIYIKKQETVKYLCQSDSTCFDLLVPCAVTITNWSQHSQEAMDPRCFLNTFANGKEQSEEKERKKWRKGRQTSKQMVQTVQQFLWATGRRNVLIFEGCKTFVRLQCLKRNFILTLTTKAAFDKTVFETRSLLCIFPPLCCLVNCCPCTVLRFHLSICSFKMCSPPRVWKSRRFRW